MKGLEFHLGEKILPIIIFTTTCLILKNGIVFPIYFCIKDKNDISLLDVFLKYGAVMSSQAFCFLCVGVFMASNA